MRKFIACADLHIRSNKPQYRKDNYFETVCRKFQQIINLANEHEADILIAGDLFDSVKVSHKVVNSILEILLGLKGTAYATAGQHDMSFHTLDLESSPFKTLILAGKIKFLNSDGLVLESDDIKLYGCSFGEEIHKAEKVGYFNILVIHKTITPEEPPFFLTEAISSEEMLDAEECEHYNLIISGDYHQSFVVQKWGHLLVNCGPMMREKIDQVDLKPRVHLITIDSEDGVSTKPLFLDIESAENVFSLDLVKKADDSKFSEGLEELVKTLKDGKNKPDYKQTVDVMVKESKCGVEVKNKVNELWEKANG